jgi:surface protein
MDGMFQSAIVFNQNISGWDITLVSTRPPVNFSTNSPLTAANNPNWQNLRNFPDLNKLTTDTSFNLTAPDSNSPGSFTYESSDSSVATISGSMVTIVGEGTTTITATQAPSGNFLIRTITATLTISPPPTPPPSSQLELDSTNETTIRYIAGSSIASEPLFILADPRNTGTPQLFAVVTNASTDQIKSYARNEANGIAYFTQGQPNPVPFSNIVTTLMTDMSNLFNSALSFNEDISSWDTAKVTNMNGMFYNADDFNQPIGSWDTAKVTSMISMFENAYAFNQYLSGWDVSLVSPKPPSGFSSNSPLTGANTPVWFPLITRAANKVTIQFTLTSIGSSEPAFIQADPRNTGSQEWFAVVTNASRNQITSYARNEPGGISYFTTLGQLVPFNNIVTTLMTDMNNMFNDAQTFNQDISSWDTSNVTSMYAMFIFALAFNKNIGAWNTALVTDMDRMFKVASAFNQNIGSWNTALVTTMYAMFDGATAFNQNISGWDVALTPARPSLSITDFATGSPLALAENSHKLPLFQS